VLSGGRITYRIKKLGGGRTKHRVMTPLELLARLAALVPPPRYPLVRYHGVLAPHSAWRREIIPRPPTDPNDAAGTSRIAASRTSCARATSDDPAALGARGMGERSGRAHEPQHTASTAGTSARPSAPALSGGAVGPVGEFAAYLRAPDIVVVAREWPADVNTLAPNILSVPQWSRLLGGLLYAASPRLRWPQLLRRTFDVDVLECPKCHGRLRIIEAVVEADAARQILERLGLPVDTRRSARARDPTTLEGEEPDAA
jgi:hypothetical protein